MNPNLLPEEQFRHYGTISSNHFETLLDTKSKLDAYESNSGYIKEAKSTFIGEDFLSSELAELKNFLNSLNKSPKKSQLSAIIDSIENAVNSEKQSAEYGNEQLSKFLKAIS